MTLSLGLFAGIIFFVYSVYFIKIIKGTPEDFEGEILESLAEWMISKGSASKGQMWILLLLSVLLEVAYFTLVFYGINNLTIIVFTLFFAVIELYHLAMLSHSLNRFFKGKIVIKKIFNWKFERLSAMLFFTHSLLILLLLIFF